MPYMFDDVQGMPPNAAQLAAMQRAIQAGVYSPPGGSPQPRPPSQPAPTAGPPHGGPAGPVGPAPMGPMSILGGGAPPQAGPVPDNQRGLAGMLEDNSMALLMGGMSALSGKGVLPGMQTGMAYDAKQKSDKDRKAQADRARQSLMKLYPQHAQIIEALNDPQEALRHITQQQREAREQGNADRNYDLAKRAQDRADQNADEIIREVDGNLVRYDRRTGESKELYKAPNAGTSVIKGIREREAYARDQGLDLKDPKVASWIRTGNEQKDTQRQITAQDRQAIRGYQSERIEVDDAIKNLEELNTLNPDVPTGWFSKTSAGVRNAIGASTPESEKLTRFNQLMNSEAIAKMSAALKGATTDKEMAEFQRIVGDSSLPLKVRQDAIDQMLRKARSRRALLDDQEYEARGGDYSLEGQQKRQGNKPDPFGVR